LLVYGNCELQWNGTNAFPHWEMLNIAVSVILHLFGRDFGNASFYSPVKYYVLILVTTITG